MFDEPLSAHDSELASGWLMDTASLIEGLDEDSTRYEELLASGIRAPQDLDLMLLIDERINTALRMLQTRPTAMQFYREITGNDPKPRKAPINIPVQSIAQPRKAEKSPIGSCGESDCPFCDSEADGEPGTKKKDIDPAAMEVAFQEHLVPLMGGEEPPSDQELNDAKLRIAKDLDIDIDDIEMTITHIRLPDAD